MKNITSSASAAVKVGLCFSGILGFVNSSYGLEEAVTVEKFELKIVETSFGGDEIMAGDLAEAIEKILTTVSLDSRYEKNTNLCVAYTASGEFSSAEEHCKLALKFSRSVNSGIKNPGLYLATKEKHALALNNLGVMRALQGNTGDALEYFESASVKSKRLSLTTTRNISVLE
ncbi:MAG: tetratricopeptide repeat protein [Halioglobus sp.]